MEDTRLIMLEGLPGTGKSTNSDFLRMQLELSGRPTKWIHEVAWPHPVLFFNEASLTYEEYDLFLQAHPHAAEVLNRIAVFRKNTVGIDLLEIEWNYIAIVGKDAFDALNRFDVWTFQLDKYVDVALEKWAHFVEKALSETSATYILDSSIFQFQIFTFVLKNAPFEELSAFVQKLVDIVRPLAPSLIYFYRENVEDTIGYLEKIRGTQSLEGIWQRDKAEPYYKDKPEGVEGYKQFLRDYADAAQRLFDAVDCRKTSIEITDQDWQSYENSMLAFLGAERKTYPSALPPSGIYRNETIGIEIEVDGLSLKDPYQTIRKLTAKTDTAFYVQCLPVLLQFNEGNTITISGEQICERWTLTGTQFSKI